MSAANQYGDTFTAFIQKRFGQAAEIVLDDFRKRGLTYQEVAAISGFRAITVRKWCRRYGVQLKANTTDLCAKNLTIFEENFKSDALNKYNFLNRKWG
ncbi:MerR family transcriptional regulator [Facilibium subflavum]|uniref:hypothetical protein n=1 Tax=Facilibium subflavum TaxID=2219058 RepID=UPI000E65948F|nr:hypothetical protein [Facilibium subflavum]